MRIDRIEPPCWWCNMKTALQLMIYGKDLAGCKVKVKEEGLSIKKVYEADSPDYLFLDIIIDKDTQPGEYTFEVTGAQTPVIFSYPIYKRKRGSANRKSFSSADMVYMLMPDRFANGDPSNDSTPDTIEKVNRKEPFGRHGGDLQGIIDHLDYLENLGVTTLWLTPPQLDNEPTQSYHGYSCGDFYTIDPRFGTNELYRELVKKAHTRNMKVIMDAVPNHCGTTHWWMKNLPFKEWVHTSVYPRLSNYRLATLSDPNASVYDRRHTVEGWFDKTMPDLAIEHPILLHYLLQAYIWWIEWADLDGLRVDTFPYNNRHAIAKWTNRILEEYPDLNIVAECWHSSPAIVAYWQGKKINHDAYCSNLPTVMDFPLQEALEKGFSVDSAEWAEGMNTIYEAVALDFLYADPESMLIFLDNHDTGRFADAMKGDVNKIKLGITFLATFRGIPQIYYGTEYGFRSLDPEQGHGTARKDFPGGWKGDRKNLFTGKGANKKEQEIFTHTCKLFNWRKQSRAVQKGKTIHFLPAENTYAYFRTTHKECVFVFLNPSAKEVQINWKQFSECLEGYSHGISILDNKKVTVGKKLIVAPRSSFVVEFK